MERGQTPPYAMNRRSFLSHAAAASAAAALAPLAGRVSQAAEGREDGFRFVFMPCIHLRRDLRSPEGFASALQAVQSLSPAPDFILTGGDLCQNMRDQTLDQCEEITDLFLEVVKQNCSLPIHHCLGNHDLAAWNQTGAADDPRYGKNLTLQKFGMKNRYYSLDHAGWHVVVLDYLHVTAPGRFAAEIDADQLAWLRADLAKSEQRPTIAVTHAPVISAVELFSDRARRTEEALAVPIGRVIGNAPELVAAAGEGNVRSFLSGHLHLVERLELLGHSFICSGSVSGHQWTGPRMGTPEGFGVFDCHPDGRFEFQYESHGWVAGRG